MIFVDNSIPIKSPIWCTIFNSPEFYTLHKNENTIYLSIKNETDIVGVAHFHIQNQTFKSPIKGTFGGIEVNPNTSYYVKEEIIQNVLKFLKNLGARKITISSPPFAHNNQKSNSIFNILLNSGFQVSNHEINHAIEIDNTPLIDKMRRNNKKRLKKCQREGFLFELLKNKEDCKKVYNVIAENRKNKGYKISMSFQQIMEMTSLFPKDIYFFQTSFEGKIAASSICIKITNDILYVFYWGDIKGFEHYSPISHLASGIYNFAKENAFKLMDVGTSSVQGMLHHGVAIFKENLGFSTSLKLTYSKDYE